MPLQDERTPSESSAVEDCVAEKPSRIDTGNLSSEALKAVRHAWTYGCRAELNRLLRLERYLPEAVRTYHAAAVAGDAEAQTILGLIYVTGEGGSGNGSA